MEVTHEAGAALQAELGALRTRTVDRAARSAITARRIVYAGTAVYALLFLAAGVIHFE